MEECSKNVGNHLKMPGTSSKFRTEDQQILGSGLGDRRPYFESVPYENADWINLALDSVLRSAVVSVSVSINGR